MSETRAELQFKAKLLHYLSEIANKPAPEPTELKSVVDALNRIDSTLIHIRDHLEDIYNAI